jgi:hypothetical protein
MPRTYTRRQKVTAVLAADMTNPKAAAEAIGVPRSTLRAWLEKPEFATLRQNARESIAEEAIVVARLAYQALGNAIIAGRVEPRDLINAAGMATEKALLASGEATSRSEHRDLDPDTVGIEALEELIARSGTAYVPVGVEPRRNGAHTNGQH